MAQRSLMYYAYFRFYLDESTIEAGLETYCTGWEHMFEVGYNYKEYKCFVDNLGGFEHFVGDMRGYISQTRETGFLDGSPSDAVYDSGLLMGAEKITETDVLILNGVARNTNIFMRKIVAQDAGIAHKFKLVCGDAVITHPCMYTIDRNQIEILKPEADITDSSDVDSYEFTADIQKAFLTGGAYDSKTCGTITNFANMVDRDASTFGEFSVTLIESTCSFIFDMGESFTAIAVDIYNDHDAVTYKGKTTIYTSADTTSWTEIGNTGFVHGRVIIGDNNVTGRYIKVLVNTAAAWNGMCKIYRVLCS